MIPGDMLEELPEGEYYWRDIIGLDVYMKKGNIWAGLNQFFPQAAMMFMSARVKEKYFCRLLPKYIQQIDIDKSEYDCKIAGRAIKVIKFDVLSIFPEMFFSPQFQPAQKSSGKRPVKYLSA